MATQTISIEKLYNFLDVPVDGHYLLHGIQLDWNRPAVVSYDRNGGTTFDLELSCQYVAISDAIRLVRDVFGLDPDDHAGVDPKSHKRVIFTICSIPRDFMKRIDPDFVFHGLPKMLPVTMLLDSSCDMASVLVDGECVMEGNFHDFYPGCHGITKYGDFRGPLSLAAAVASKLRRKGHKVSIWRQRAKYNDNGVWDIDDMPEQVK